MRADARTLEATRAWLERYVKRLEEVIREEEAKHISMEAILDYLRENAEVRGFFKRTWDAELADIKQKRPDIVASWKYYAEFERICAGFGGAAESLAGRENCGENSSSGVGILGQVNFYAGRANMSIFKQILLPRQL